MVGGWYKEYSAREIRCKLPRTISERLVFIEKCLVSFEAHCFSNQAWSGSHNPISARWPINRRQRCNGQAYPKEEILLMTKRCTKRYRPLSKFQKWDVQHGPRPRAGLRAKYSITGNCHALEFWSFCLRENERDTQNPRSVLHTSWPNRAMRTPVVNSALITHLQWACNLSAEGSFQIDALCSFTQA